MENFKVLGINFGGHDTSACLMVDGKLIACCEEERYGAEKHTREFPINAINDCLDKAGIDINSLDEVAFTYNPDILFKNGNVSKIRRSLLTKDEYKNILKEKTGYEGKTVFWPHHLCHVASAYFPSGFEKALLLSNDGIGEITCSMIATGDKGKIRIVHKGNEWPHSLGLVYAAITNYLGWKASYDEGIVMGLAPYGDDSGKIPGSDMTYKEVFSELMYPTGDYDIEVSPDWTAFHAERDKWVSDKFINLFGPKRKWEDPITDVHKNIACALQRRLEEIVIGQIRKARIQTGMNKLCISGGVGLNCSLNGKIEKSKIFDEIFVQPASGDAGVSLGACYLSNKRNNKSFQPEKWHNFYLGSSFSDSQIEEYLNEEKVSYKKLNGDYETVAEILSRGDIVGWYQGGSEFGPRALGNRSILASPFPASMKDHINERVKFREEFRPFAPAVMSEKCEEYFDISQESPHMLIACKVREDKINSIPAVVHVDNSARVQTVSSSNNLRFRKILESFYERTGVPVLLNTSFNVKGQPIVNTPEEAFKCFNSTKIDALVIGDCLVIK